MKTIRMLNPIAKIGLDKLPSDYTVSDTEVCPDAILVRSASMHDMEFPSSLLAVARAGAGVNNIPVASLTEKGIVVFNTPGANANGVKELTLASLFLAARDIYGGIKWTETLAENVAKTVEKGKKQFAGIELKGKTLGVMGLGAIGGAVAASAASEAIGMNVLGYDPYLSPESASSLPCSVKLVENYEEVFDQADFITLHLPLADNTRGLLNREAFSRMKDGVRVINLSRAELVDTDALLDALNSGKLARYVTDFPTDETVKVPNLITVPHLGASTEESEDNCAILAVTELIDFLENGNIKNSVNFPNVNLPRASAVRLCVAHRNIPGMLSKISLAISDYGINIAHMASASKGDIAYTLVDLDKEELPVNAKNLIDDMEGVLSLRLIS